MRNALIVGAACAAGLVGGLVAAYLKPAAPMAAESRSANDGLDARLSDIEVAFARMEERVRTLEVAPPLSAAAPRSATPEAPLEAAGEAAAPAADPAAPPSDPQLDERIRAVIAEKERTEREEQRKRFEEMAAEREKSLLERLATELGLTPWQTEQVGVILAKRRDAMAAMRDRMFTAGAPPDPARRDAARAEFQKIREETDKELQALLSADQFDAVQKIVNEQFGPGPGSGRGGMGPPR